MFKNILLQTNKTTKLQNPETIEIFPGVKGPNLLRTSIVYGTVPYGESTRLVGKTSGAVWAEGTTRE